MVQLTLKKIRLLRLEKAYSQEYIAMKLNISQSYYAKIEKGNAELSLTQLFILLNLLDIDSVDFFKAVKISQKNKNNNQ